MVPTPPVNNRILANLPQGDRDRICRQGELVTLTLGEVVCDPDRPTAYAYFPNAGVLSCLVVVEDGHATEAASIGYEGMAGFALLFEVATSPLRVVQQVAGEMLRVPAAVFREAVAESKLLYQLLARYAMTLLQQCGQNVACAARHSVNQRMCRWLLTSSDRMGSNEFDITQEYLGMLLGVRRQTVGSVALALQRSGCISYRRGHLKIHDRTALEQSACECYRTLQEAYEQVMKLPSAAVPSLRR